MNINTNVRTKTSHGYDYGVIGATMPDHQDGTLYRVDWVGGGYDWLYACEVEVLPSVPMLRLTQGMVCIPMQDESNCNHYAHANANQWVYTLDGKKHGRVPAVVLPGLEHIWGGESAIRKAGYRKHWCVFVDDRTGRITFGNYRSFSTGGPAERAIAEAMHQVEIADLMNL